MWDLWLCFILIVQWRSLTLGPNNFTSLKSISVRESDRLKNQSKVSDLLSFLCQNRAHSLRFPQPLSRVQRWVEMKLQSLFLGCHLSLRSSHKSPRGLPWHQKGNFPNKWWVTYFGADKSARHLGAPRSQVDLAKNFWIEKQFAGCWQWPNIAIKETLSWDKARKVGQEAGDALLNPQVHSPRPPAAKKRGGAWSDVGHLRLSSIWA